MKAIYLFWTVFLLTAPVYAQYTDVPHDDGPVLPNKRLAAQQIKVEKAYSYQFGKKGIQDSVLLWTKFYTYNPLGQIVKQEVKTGAGNIQSYTKYSYNSGLVVKQMEFTPKSKSKADSMVFEFGYDTLGNQRFIYKYSKDTSNLRTTEKIYNSKKQQISVLLKIVDGEFFTIRNLTYNENGDLAALEYLDGNGNTIAEYSFTYDYQARKRLTYITVKEKKKLYEAYTYNINKDCIRMEQFNYIDPKNTKSAVPYQTTKYYFDDVGLLGNEVTYQGADMITFIKHFYSK